MLDNGFYDKAASGSPVTLACRAAPMSPRRGARWTRRSPDGNGLRMANPVQRFWCDVGLAPAIHVPGSVFHASALTDRDVEPPPGPMLSMI
ncbi:hypothetical protein [Amycolatopsis sp. NPDC054798]